MNKRLIFLLLPLLLTASTLSSCEAQDSALIRIEGSVYGPDGTPLQDTLIRLWGFYLEGETLTNSTGHYELFATTTEASCQLYVHYDDPETEGYDLLPTLRRLSTSEDLNVSIDFTLKPAATVLIKGQLKPMESTKMITKHALEVVDPLTGNVLQFGEYRLVYGTGMNVQV